MACHLNNGSLNFTFYLLNRILESNIETRIATGKYAYNSIDAIQVLNNFYM